MMALFLHVLDSHIPNNKGGDWVHCRLSKSREFTSVLYILDSHIPNRGGGNWVRWRLKKSEEFDVCLFYNAQRGLIGLPFPWKGIRGVRVSQRVTFFIWMVAWGKILTYDNLISLLGLYLIVNWCSMCHCSGETVDFLLHCNIVFNSWSLAFRSFWRSTVFYRQWYLT